VRGKLGLFALRLYGYIHPSCFVEPIRVCSAELFGCEYRDQADPESTVKPITCRRNHESEACLTNAGERLKVTGNYAAFLSGVTNSCNGERSGFAA